MSITLVGESFTTYSNDPHLRFYKKQEAFKTTWSHSYFFTSGKVWRILEKLGDIHTISIHGWEKVECCGMFYRVHENSCT